MKIKKLFAVAILFLNLVPTFVLAIDEGIYTDGVRFLSVLKNPDNSVKLHFIEFDINEWEAFSGYENADGSVDIFSHSDENSARWNISTTAEGVKAVRERCLGEDCGGNAILSLALYLPDTGGDFSGLYQSLAFQNLIIHQVGNRALSIDLFKDPDPYSNEHSFEILRWELIDDTLNLVATVYSTFNEDTPFDGLVSATFSDINNTELTVTIENCVVTREVGLNCDDFEDILSSKKVF